MKKLLALLFFSIFWLHIQAQPLHKIQEQFGDLYQKMAQEGKNKNYAQACTFGSEAEPLAEKALESNQEKIASFYYNFAGFCAAAGEAEKAEKAYKQCLAIRKKALGVQHPDYIKTVDKLAQFYTQTNRQAEADKLLAQLKKEQNTTTAQNSTKTDTQNSDTAPQGAESPEFAKTLTNQALTQIKARNFKEAEKNLTRAIGIYQKNNLQNTDFATASDAFGIVIVSQKGSYKEAIPHFENAYNIRKKELGENHQLSQESAFNLAVCYTQTRQYPKAQALFENILQNFEKSNQQSSPKYQETLISLAGLYLDGKNITKADPLLQKAYQIEQKNSQKSPQYVDLLNDLARLEFIRKNYHVAENYYRNAIEHYTATKNQNTLEYATALTNLGNILKEQNKNVEAEKTYQQAQQVLKGLKQEKSPEFLEISMHLAELLSKRGENEKAIKTYQQILPQLKELVGENHPYYWKSLANVADCFAALRKYKEARPYYEQLINNSAAQSSPNYPVWLINLGGFYYETGKYQESEKLFIQALQSYESQMQGVEVDYIETLEIVANLYKNQGRFTEAEKLYSKAIDFCKKQFGEKHFTFTTLQNNLAKLYKSLGRYEDAEQIYKQALARFTKADENSTAYAQLLNDYAVLYSDAGKFKEAEPYFETALSIFQKQTGEKSAEYANVLQNYGNLQRKMGRFSEAITNFQKCLSIRKEVLGELHPDYAVTLNALASLYKKAGNFEKAEPLYQEALNIRKNLFGEENPEYATSLDNLANFYQNTQQNAKAEPLYKKSLEIRKKIFGANHPIIAASMNNLAVLYTSTKQFAQAEQFYKDALAILKTNLSDKHPNYLATLNNFCMLLQEQGKFQVAMPLFQQLTQNTLSLIQKNFSTLSENEKRQFWAVNKPYLDNFVLFTANCVKGKIPKNEALAGEALDLLVMTKGIILNSTGKARKEILTSKDAQLLAQYDEWVKLREMIAKLSNLGTAELKRRGINLDSLENKAKNLEKSLSAKSKAFDEAFSSKVISWKDIQKRLSDKEVWLEFLRVQGENKEVLYVVFAVKKDSKNPEVLTLNNGKILEQEELYFYKNSAKFRKEDKESYKNFWKPLETLIGNAQKIYYSPDGVYSQINPLALWDTEKNEYLWDRADIIFLTSAKDLLEKSTATKLQGKALLLGNPFYQIDNNLKINADAINLDEQSSYWIQNPVFTSLPATDKEISNIESILQKLNGLQVKKLLRAEATETNLKKEMGQYNLLHLATHGFFIPSDFEERSNAIISTEIAEDSQESNDPLLRSGLILAGVTDYFVNAKRSPDQEDGILTAYEIMNLPLDNVNLVVLSACETGLGKVQAGEGVYGLQRAFRIAGAKNLIMSLWKVDDTATQELMQSFYSELLKNPNQVQAFRNAQKQIREKYKHPYYWAGFVMLGE
jgi:tetratricopeptide (TPR) repeat protein